MCSLNMWKHFILTHKKVFCWYIAESLYHYFSEPNYFYLEIYYFSNEEAHEFRSQSLQEVTFSCKNCTFTEQCVDMIVDTNLKIRATVVSITHNNTALISHESCIMKSINNQDSHKFNSIYNFVQKIEQFILLFLEHKTNISCIWIWNEYCVLEVTEQNGSIHSVLWKD